MSDPIDLMTDEERAAYTEALATLPPDEAAALRTRVEHALLRERLRTSPGSFGDAFAEGLALANEQPANGERVVVVVDPGEPLRFKARQIAWAGRVRPRGEP